MNCLSDLHHSRRTLLRGATAAGVSWLTPLADILAAEAERAPKGKPAKSLILLWLGGAASQLDTFDPHPTTKIGGGVKVTYDGADMIVEASTIASAAAGASS